MLWPFWNLHKIFYITPFDKEVGRRISHKTLFGNLIDGLHTEVPEVFKTHTPHFSGTKESFETTITKISSDIEEIFIFIDGLDHISRVLHQNPHISPTEASIVEELDSLSLPDNIHIVFGSQPGEHLRSIVSDEAIYEIPKWEEPESKELVQRIIGRHSLNNQEWDQVIGPMYSKSEGNPLYLTYIANELAFQFLEKENLELLMSIDSIPSINGEIANYYEHLLGIVRKRSQEELLAKIFGIVDFALSKEELSKILGPFYTIQALSDSIKTLRPILSEKGAQGGYRIYHESFRRFIYDRVQSSHDDIGLVLSPVIQWLESLGFYKSQKCYKFLFQTLFRAGKFQEIKDRVDFEFLVMECAPKSVEFIPL